MIDVPKHISDALERISGRESYSWSVSRNGKTWSGYAEWSGGEAWIWGCASIDEAMQTMLGRLLEVEADAVTEVRRVRAPSSLPELRSEQRDAITRMVAGAPANLPR